jgi:hypothetical protein
MATLATHPEHTGRHDLPLSGLDLPLYRLYLMRAGYLLMGVGIAVVKWPQIVSHGDDWPLFEGVVACILTAMSLLAFLGLRYPVKLLPLLLFESAWKLLWLGVVALPNAVAGTLDSATQEVVINCSLVIVILAVTPWRYVWRQYARAPGDRWRRP